MNTIPNPTPMGDDDIHAFGRPTPVATVRPRRRWPWVLLALGVLGLVLALFVGSLLWQAMQGAHGLAGLGDWHFGWHDDGWHGELGPGGAIALLLALLAATGIVTVVVPLVLLGAGLAVGLVLALGAVALVVTLALGIGAVVLVLLLVSSPLWLLGLLLWWALKPSAVASSSAA